MGRILLMWCRRDRPQKSYLYLVGPYKGVPMLDSVLTLVAVIVLAFGIGIFSLAFKSGYNRIAAFVVGLLVIALSVYIMPHKDRDQPDVYYRK
jgi:hypothetical protein